MLKSSPIFKRNGAHLVEKKTFEKNKDHLFLRFECFEHVNFVIKRKYSQNIYDNPNYYGSLLIFQTYKNVDLKSVHSLGWLLRL
jgi:hypothetical protein